MIQPEPAPVESANRELGGILRKLAAPIYLPWFSVGLGTAMLIPILPVYLRDLNFSFTAVSYILAAAGLGAAVAGLPFGGALQRFGERHVLVLSVTIVGLATALTGASGAIGVLVVLQLASGAGLIGVRLAQQSFVSVYVPTHFRGRAMSTMGGTMRLAAFVGPFIGGVLADLTSAEAAFVTSGVVTVAGLVPMIVIEQRGRTTNPLTELGANPSTGVNDASSEPNPDHPAAIRLGVIAALRGSWLRLLSVGVAPALVMAVRSGRQIVIPLIADDLGLSATAVGTVVAIGTGADLLLFPVAGWLMDRFGRLYATVPAFGLMGLGLLILGTVDSAVGVVVAGVIIGIGNGMSSGTMLTIGSDLAPRDIRGPFLAAIGSLQDVGKIIGPLVIGWSADAAGLDISAVALAVVMFVAIGWLIVVVGETRDLDEATGRTSVAPHP
jgi:MFS family permease